MIIRESKIRIESVIQSLTAGGTPEGEVERTTFEAVGYYHLKDSSHALVTYTESAEGGNITSELLILPTSVRVKKQGAIISDMRIEAGITDLSVYSIPPYKFDMTVEGVSVEHTLTEGEGRVFLEYKMKVGGADRHAEMKIWIQPL